MVSNSEQPSSINERKGKESPFRHCPEISFGQFLGETGETPIMGKLIVDQSR